MKIVFLDRDGVINRYPGDRDYVKAWAEFCFLSGVKAALKRLKAAGYYLCVISNQAGVAKGVYPKKNLDLITTNMLNELKKSGVIIDGVYYCLHRDEDNCPCRKPKAGLIHLAIDNLKQGEEAFSIDSRHTFVVGDTIRDIQAGKSAGFKTILVFSGKEKPSNKANWQAIPDFTASDLVRAADIILRHN